MTKDIQARRSMLSGMGVAAAALALGAGTAKAQTPGGGFQPARHEQDAWLGALQGQHRVFVDSATAAGGGEALLYANNLYTANMNDYSLAPSELAIVVCLRHFSTPFGYNDAMWAKYGSTFTGIIQFTDPKTQQAPTSNLYNSADYGFDLPNVGTTVGSLAERGTQFGVCAFATTFFAGRVAAATGQNAETVFEELTSNAIPNSRFVSAGVVALTRAQECGYSLLYAG